MSLKFRAYLTAAIVSLALAAAVFAQNKPQPDTLNQPDALNQPNASGVPRNTGFVNDYANVIDAATKTALEKRLKDLSDGSAAKIQIAVLTVRTTGDKEIFDYSLAVAREWKIGSKEQDNPGLLLVVAIDDRKYFTQVSRDAEGDISDGLAGQIQRQYLVPAFKAGQYGKGIQDTVEAYIRRFGETRGFDPNTLQKTDIGITAPPVAGKTKGGSSFFVCAVCGGIIAIIVFIFIMSSLSGAAGATRRSSWNGGSFGGGGKRKGDGSAVVDAVVPMIIGGIIGSIFSGGSGGSSGGSGWGGGSGGGGGGGGDWGGFGGGGDFGGGGAGGGW